MSQSRSAAADLSPHRLLESVVHITKHRDQHSLEESWVTTMMELLDARLVRLVRFADGDGELEEVARAARREREVSVDTPRKLIRLEEEPALRACLERGEVVSEEHAEGLRLIYPVALDGEVRGAFAVTCNRTDRLPEDDRLVVGFLRIYQNYLAVLDDSQRDTLTGLFNRKTFDERIGTILADIQARDELRRAGAERRSAPDGASHWLGILDIDHFKSINDTYGHLYGDEVLLLFSQIMRRTFRSRDLLFRYGGEEFVVVLDPTDMEHAVAAFERFRHALEAYGFPQVGRVTVSIGIVRIDSQAVPSAVVGHADQALYYAKHHGRNRVCSYERLVAGGQLDPPREVREEDEAVELF